MQVEPHVGQATAEWPCAASELYPGPNLADRLTALRAYFTACAGGDKGAQAHNRLFWSLFTNSSPTCCHPATALSRFMCPPHLCQVASRVWQLVVVDSQLVDHLAALKDYMLLAKGDFYQCFLTDAAQLLAKPVQTIVQKDVGEPMVPVLLPWLRERRANCRLAPAVTLHVYGTCQGCPS